MLKKRDTPTVADMEAIAGILKWGGQGGEGSTVGSIEDAAESRSDLSEGITVSSIVGG